MYYNSTFYILKEKHREFQVKSPLKDKSCRPFLVQRVCNEAQWLQNSCFLCFIVEYKNQCGHGADKWILTTQSTSYSNKLIEQDHGIIPVYCLYCDLGEQVYSGTIFYVKER